MPLQAEIRHHGGDDAGLREAAVVAPALGDHRKELVAVDQMAALVHDHHAVGIAVERDADIGAHFADLAAQRLGRGRAAVVVDVEAVRFDADRHDFGAELPQRVGRHPVGGAVGAIDDHAKPIQRQVARQRALGEFDVAVVHAVDALGAAEVHAFGEPLGDVAVDQPLDAELDVVGQLVAVRPEQFYAVVVVRIVRGRDHDAEIGAHRSRQHGDGRRRDRAEQQHVHADRGEAGDQRRLDHVAGEPGVLADHDAMAVIAAAEGQPRRLADFERQFRRDHAIGATANAVGAEILTDHTKSPPPGALSRKRGY